MVFSIVSPSSFSVFVGFLHGLDISGRLNPSDLTLLLVTLVFVDMIECKIQCYAQNTQISI